LHCRPQSIWLLANDVPRRILHLGDPELTQSFLRLQAVVEEKIDPFTAICPAQFGIDTLIKEGTFGKEQAWYRII